MSRSGMLRQLQQSVRTMLEAPRASAHDLTQMTARVRGTETAGAWTVTRAEPVQEEPSDPLRSYFDSVSEGPGIWKWLHYFEIYHRHLARFVGRSPALVEVGVYSGGSLGMWRHYFGDGAHIHGVDIQPDCRAYEGPGTSIHIGDQGDREFWRAFRERVPPVDVLIDDGGHQPEQQIVTLEEMLPHLKPGGVFICEDVHGINNEFTAYVSALADRLNAFAPAFDQRVLSSSATALQSDVHSIHFYPYVIVIEKRSVPLASLSAPKHGTMWQPFRTSVA